MNTISSSLAHTVAEAVRLAPQALVTATIAAAQEAADELNRRIQADPEGWLLPFMKDGDAVHALLIEDDPNRFFFLFSPQRVEALPELAHVQEIEPELWERLRELNWQARDDWEDYPLAL